MRRARKFRVEGLRGRTTAETEGRRRSWKAHMRELMAEGEQNGGVQAERPRGGGGLKC
jgi:hypothetical protein